MITRLIAILTMAVLLFLGTGTASYAQHGAPHSHSECTNTPGANVYSRFEGGPFSGTWVTYCNVVTNDTTYVSAGDESSWTVGVARSTYTSTSSRGYFAQSTSYGDVVSCTNPAGQEVGGKAMANNPHCQHPFS